MQRIYLMISYFILLSFYSFSANAMQECERVSPHYQNTDIMYVVCTDLSAISVKDANLKITRILAQYTGEPDEMQVYFVTSNAGVGKTSDALAQDLLASYYTHDHILTLWPNISTQTKQLQLSR